jgi:hypothetical protein
MSDEANVYARPGTWFVDHQTVNHSAKEYVWHDAYTNTIEGYFSILKRGIYGVYFHVSEAHLHRYLSEFEFRYSQPDRVGVDDTKRTDLTILSTRGKRLTDQTNRSQRAADAPPF